MTIRPIDAQSFAARVALYMAENAYLNDTALDVLKKVSNWLEEEPILDYTPVRHAQWQYRAFRRDEGAVVSGIMCCPECSSRFLRAVGTWFKYCPECGARMDGKRNEQ